MQSETTIRAPGADMGQLDEVAPNLGAPATESASSNGEGPAQAIEDVVTVEDDVVLLENFTESDPDVVALIGRATDQAEAVHRLLRIGAQAAKVVETDLSANMMEGRIGALNDHVDERFNEFAAIVESIVDPEAGSLATFFAVNRQKIDEAFNEAVDADKKSSPISAFVRVFEEAATEAAGSLSGVLSLDDEDSQLFKIREELKGVIAEQTTKLEGDIQGVRDLVAGEAGIASEREKGTAKGRDYEDQVYEEASCLAVPYRDLVEDVGKVVGSAGTKKGDSVVHLSLEDTFGLDGRIVFEAKNTALGIRETFEQIEGAMLNRDAQVGVAVFASQDQAPTAVPFQESDTKAIVVYNPDEGIDALRLAYMWARTKVRQELASNAGFDIDVARVSALVDEARQALAVATTIKGNHTKAKNAIEKATEGVDDLVGKAREVLDKLADELASTSDEG
jgi:hypothetical protein